MVRLLLNSIGIKPEGVGVYYILRFSGLEGIKLDELG
jgi:hypothetical protein